MGFLAGLWSTTVQGVMSWASKKLFKVGVFFAKISGYNKQVDGEVYKMDQLVAKIYILQQTIDERKEQGLSVDQFEKQMNILNQRLRDASYDLNSNFY